MCLWSAAGIAVLVFGSIYNSFSFYRFFSWIFSMTVSGFQEIEQKETKSLENQAENSGSITYAVFNWLRRITKAFTKMPKKKKIPPLEGKSCKDCYIGIFYMYAKARKKINQALIFPVYFFLLNYT
jgi:hypothetical protein